MILPWILRLGDGVAFQLVDLGDHYVDIIVSVIVLDVPYFLLVNVPNGVHVVSLVVLVIVVPHLLTDFGNSLLVLLIAVIVLELFMILIVLA